MAKDYGAVFGSDPRTNTGLSPTFIIFQVAASGLPVSSPAITEMGASTGFYYFSYGPTNAIYFELDGGSGLSTGDRYLTGILDPIQVVDQRIGTISDSYGSTAVDPTTVFGKLNRNQEFLEGDNNFNKTNGELIYYARGGTVAIQVKTLSNSAGTVTKT